MYSQSNHLRDRFCHLLEKIKNDGPINVPYISQFESIKDDILFKTEDGLYYQWHGGTISSLFDLIDALSECWAFARKRDAALDQKKGLLSWSVYPSDFRFRRKMALRLGQLEEKLHQEGRWSLLRRATLRKERITPPANYDTIIASSVENYLIQSRQARDYEGFSAMAITGGPGMTKFARKAFDSLSQGFDIRIWEDAGEESRKMSEKQSVVKQMLEAVGFNYDNKSTTTQLGVVHALKEVRKRLEGKRYLIVFAVIRHEHAYWYSDLGFNLPQGRTFEDKISHALPKGSGGVVIVTTLHEGKAIEMVGNRNKVIPLDHLLEDVSCLIFERALNEERTTQDDLQIAQKLKNYILKDAY